MEKGFAAILLCLASWCIASAQKPVMWPVIHRDYVAWVPLPNADTTPMPTKRVKDTAILLTPRRGHLSIDSMMPRESIRVVLKPQPASGIQYRDYKSDTGGTLTINETYLGRGHLLWEEYAPRNTVLISQRHFVDKGDRFVEWIYIKRQK